MKEDEVELMDYLYIIWKRKWLIIIPTLFLVIAAGLISFLLPKMWEVDTIIVPSKFFVQTEGGEFSEVVVTDPKQLAGQVNQASYNALIAAELEIDIRKFPRLRAENLRDTQLVRVSLREKDIEKAKLILHSVFNHLKIDLDKKIEVEIKGVETQVANNQNLIKQKNLDIQSSEIEKSKLKSEITSAQNKLKISEERFKNIFDEMKSVKERIDEIEKQQRKALAERKEGTDALSILLYSNEIQQNLRYYNTLEEYLSNEKIIQENYRLLISEREKSIKQVDTQIEKLKNEIKDVENQIDLLNERKGRIDYTKLLKEPTSSLSPVSPNKKLIVLIAGVLSLMIFTMLALFYEYLEKQKVKGKA